MPQETHKIMPPKPKQSLGTTIIASILLVVITVSFVAVPAVSFVGGGAFGSTEFGRYGKRRVVLEEGSFFNQQIRQYLNMFGENANDPFFMSLIFQQAFNQAMMHEAWIYEAQRAGVLVSQREVLRHLRDISNFTEAGFARLSTAERVALVQQMREGIVVEHFQHGLFDGVRRSSLLLEILAHPSAVERRVELLYIPFSRPQPQLAQVFIQGEAALFDRAVMRRLVVFGDRRTAETTATRLATGEMSLSDMAYQQFDMLGMNADIYAQEGGLLGVLFRHELQAQLANSDAVSALFELAPGEMSGVVALNSGQNGQSFAIYQMVNREPAINLNDANDLEHVLRYIRTQRQGFFVDYLISQLGSLERAEQWDVVARVLGGEWIVSDFFPAVLGLDRGQRYSPYTAQVNQLKLALNQVEGGSDIARQVLVSQHFFEQAFGLPLATLSEPVVVDDGLIIFKVLEERSATVASLEDMAYAQMFVHDSNVAQMEAQFEQSKRYRSNFESAFTQFLQRTGLNQQRETIVVDDEMYSPPSSKDAPTDLFDPVSSPLLNF